MDELVEVPRELRGLVIGRGGWRLREIEGNSGVRRIEMKEEGAFLRGTQEQKDRAKEMILSIVSQSQREALSSHTKDVNFPVDSTGFLIGRRGETIRGIQHETGTKIRIDDGVAHIQGPTQEHIKKAEEKINSLVLMHQEQKKAFRRQYSHNREVFAVVDGTCVGEDDCFKLQEIHSNNHEKKYELVMEGDKDEEKEMAYISQLKQMLLKVLRDIRKEIEDSGNIRTDMWCHFGHVHIKGVDEDDAGKTYELEEINQNLQGTDKNTRWKADFKAGVEKLEYEALEDALKEEGRPLKVPPNTRFDYSFYSPTRHQIRFKAFVPDTNEEEGCLSFQDDVVPIKNTLLDQSSYYKYRLCAPSKTRLKVDILIPDLTFDCHLVLRTTMREVKDLTLQEEDKILIDFLDEHLKYENKNIVLPMDKLPDGFSVIYRREARRRTYPYSIDNQDDGTRLEFNLMISEEKSQEESNDRSSIQDEVKTKTDIHVHCDKWDELLNEEGWEPEEIVSKLPDFLRFVRSVQSNLQVNSTELDE